MKYITKYRCKLCSGVFNGDVMHPIVDDVCLTPDTLYLIPDTNNIAIKFVGLNEHNECFRGRISKSSQHICKDGNIGFGEFVGVEKV